MTPNLTVETIRTVGTRTLAALSAVLAAAVIATGFLTGVESHWPAMVLAVALMIFPLLTASHGHPDGTARIAMGATLVALPALLLQVAEGMAWQTDLHMVFFAALAAVAILLDARAILGATLVVAVHHLGLGLLAPAWLFAGPASLPRILLHAVVLLAEAGTLVWLTGRMLALIEANAEAMRVSRAADAELARTRADQDRAVATVTNRLGDALAALAAGDLTHAVDEPFPPAFEPLRSDFNTAARQMRDAMAAVVLGADGIRQGSSEIANASGELARRTETNAASLAETTSALAEVDTRLQTTSRTADACVAKALEARDQVAAGRETAERASMTMQRVGQNAERIDSVIEGLDKIAFQTRVLAMNAAIEAGRAGEAGRGFAVVADLVSTLARNAEEQAREAREHVTATQAEIGSAVAQVKDVDAALADITVGVAAVHQLLDGLASANAAQAHGFGEISTAVAAIDRATQLNAATSEEASAAARLLMSEVDELARRTAQFRTGSNHPAPLALAAE